MDKKTKYQHPNSKGTVTDVKKSQDVTSTKLFPKSSRRRESPSANNFSKNDQSRKSNAQKTKNFEKRPKPKGYYHGSSKEDSKVVDNESAELGSVMAQRNKKQNLNHLLNFYYTPREVQSGWNHTRTAACNGYNYNRWLPPIQQHKYNKEQFLQANCQFVVTAKGDYSLYLNDPDILVDWKLIEQIQIHSSDNLSCPICLSPPVAGKMTRCGHVYCWPCILHYLSLSFKSWHKCPICYESIHKSDLKSVAIITENVLNIGDEISLQLMRREKGTLLAVPVKDIDSSVPLTFLSVSENFCQQIYSKLLLANDKEIMDIIEFERAQLKLELLEDPHSPENCFIDQALSDLLTREQLLFENTASQSIEKSEHVLCNKNIVSENEEIVSAKLENKKIEEHFELSDNLCHVNNESIKSNSNETDHIQLSKNMQKFHYFYQAEGGQNVFLHAMNVKMLEMQYGSLEKSPQIISGKLVEKEVGSFTEDLRRRLRYLSHLPITSQFEIAEIDLQPPIISEDVLEHFGDQILFRQKNRKRREREEQKREKKITEEENKRMGKYPKPKIQIESQKHFPQFQQDAKEFNIPSLPETVATSSPASSPSASSFDDIEFRAAEINSWSTSSEQGPSFAQMLQTNGSKNTASWPSLTSLKKEATKPNLTHIQSEELADVDPEMDEYVPPAYSQSLGDALAQALERSDLFNQKEKSNNNVINNKKKKKKGKTTILFATNMDRAS